MSSESQKTAKTPEKKFRRKRGGYPKKSVYKSREQTSSKDSQQPKPPSTDPIKSIEEQDDGEENTCVVCCDAIEFYGLGKCNHRETCALCSLRRRVLYGDNKCPICMLPIEDIVITNDNETPFESIPRTETDPSEQLGDVMKHIFLHDQQAKDHFTKLERLWQLKCPLCDLNTFASMNQLKKHVKDSHKVQFCLVCLDHRKVFLQEQKLYNVKEMKKHLEKGDPDTTIKHEYCQFCTNYFYDIDQLYDHLNKSHFTCFLCDRAGKTYLYYKDYPSLEEHFRKDHFLCEEHECKEKKYIVFADKEELRLHDVEEHLSKRKLPRNQIKNVSTIKVEYDFNSKHLEPDAPSLPPKEEKPLQEQDFPSLSGEAPTVPSISSWRAPTRSRLDIENFPSLPTQPRPARPSFMNITTTTTSTKPKKEWWAEDSEQDSKKLDFLAATTKAPTTTSTSKGSWWEESEKKLLGIVDDAPKPRGKEPISWENDPPLSAAAPPTSSSSMNWLGAAKGAKQPTSNAPVVEKKGKKQVLLHYG